MPEPTEIRLDRAARILHVSFDDGTKHALPAEYLRVESPSAEVQGHHPGQKQTVAGPPPCRHHRHRTGRPLCRPAGTFDDLHDTGIFSWDYLRELGLEKDRPVGSLSQCPCLTRPVPGPGLAGGGAPHIT